MNVGWELLRFGNCREEAVRDYSESKCSRIIWNVVLEPLC